MQHQFYTKDELSLHYCQAQPEQVSEDTEIIVCLHGFPECWLSWQQQLLNLSDRYIVIAPDLLGYNKSDKPTDPSAYQVQNLVKLFAGFIKAIGQGKKVTLVAHDWGGAIAWNIAAFYPQLIERLMIINAAHPSTFIREMFSNPKQREKSDYIHQMISAQGIQLLSENDFAFLQKMLTDSQGNPVLDEVTLKQYIQAWQTSGALQAMLQYYKQMPQLAPRDPQQQDSQFRIPNIRIEVPTLVLWGEQDKAFVVQLLDGLDDYVQDLSIVRFEHASHWLHHEYPQQVNDALVDFIERGNAV